MLRRNARLRREYLYNHSLEGKEKDLYDKKRKIRQALEGTHAGPPLLTALLGGTGLLALGRHRKTCMCRRLARLAPAAAAAGLPPPTACRQPSPLFPSLRPPFFVEGKPIPSELRLEEAELHKQVELEDDNTAVQRTHIDNEYAHAGERDPKLLITTSRDPSSRLVQFAKEVKLLFPQLPARQPRQHGESAHAADRSGIAVAAALLHSPLPPE